MSERIGYCQFCKAPFRYSDEDAEGMQRTTCKRCFTSFTILRDVVGACQKVAGFKVTKRITDFVLKSW